MIMTNPLCTDESRSLIRIIGKIDIEYRWIILSDLSKDSRMPDEAHPPAAKDYTALSKSFAKGLPSSVIFLNLCQ